MNETTATKHALGEGDRANGRYDAAHPHGRGPRTLSGSGVILIPTEQTVRVGAIGVLDAYGQILVGYNVKRAVWDIPQGVIEEGESPVQGAIRELFEETGLNLNAKDLSEIGKFSHRTREFVYPFENYLFLLELSNVDLSPVRNCEPEKCRDLGWRAPCQLPSPRGLSLRLLLVLLGRSE